MERKKQSQLCYVNLLHIAACFAFIKKPSSTNIGYIKNIYHIRYIKCFISWYFTSEV